MLDGGILLLALILNPIARRRRKRLAAEGTVASDVETPVTSDSTGPRAEQTRPSEDEKRRGVYRDGGEKGGPAPIENRSA